MAQYQFNAAQFEPTMGMEPWPDGWVPVVISNSDITGNKNGSGGHMGLVLTAQDGPMRGKNQYLAVNLWHSNPQSVEIANKQLSAIIYVTLGVNQGRLTINADTSELHNIPFLVLVTRQADNPTRNNFIAFKDIRGGDPKTGAGQQQQQAAPMTGPVSTAGWSPTGQAPAAQPAWGPPAGQPAALQPAFQPAPGTAPAWGPPAGAPAAGQPPAWGPPAGAPAPATQQPAWGPPQNTAPAPQQFAPAGQPQQFAPPQAQPQQWQPPGAPATAAPQPSWAPPGR